MLNLIRVFKCLYKNDVICAVDYVHKIWFQGFLPLEDASAECTAFNVFVLFCNLK